MLSPRALAGLGVAHFAGAFLAHFAAQPAPLAPEEAPVTSPAPAGVDSGAAASRDLQQVLGTLQEALGDCLASRAPVCPSPCPECRCECGAGASASPGWWRAALELVVGAAVLLALELFRGCLGWARRACSGAPRPAALPPSKQGLAAPGTPDPRVPRGGGQYR